MSVTTTANPVSSAVLQALTDYDIHHSGGPEYLRTPKAPDAQQDVSTPLENPAAWDTDHRRVPAYRPVQNLVGAERPNGGNAMEVAFIWTMFLGVRVIGGIDIVWRATGGKLNDRFFVYKIGGEW